MKTLTKIVRGVLIYWVCFVTVCFIACFKGVIISDELIHMGLGGGSVELICGAFIEVGKRWIEKKYHLGGKGSDGTDVCDDAPDSDDHQCDGDSGDEENVG